MIPPVLLEVKPHHRVRSTTVISIAHRSNSTRHRCSICALHRAPKQLNCSSHFTQVASTCQVSVHYSLNLMLTRHSAGVVVANELDMTRCYMLAHQTSRLGSPALIITNYEGQNYPLIQLPKIDNPTGTSKAFTVLTD